MVAIVSQQLRQPQRYAMYLRTTRQACALDVESARITSDAAQWLLSSERMRPSEPEVCIEVSQ